MGKENTTDLWSLKIPLTCGPVFIYNIYIYTPLKLNEKLSQNDALFEAGDIDSIIHVPTPIIVGIYV